MSAPLTRLGPEHAQALLPLLASALDERDDVRKGAERELNRLSRTPGFCTLLLVRSC